MLIRTATKEKTRKTIAFQPVVFHPIPKWMKHDAYSGKLPNRYQNNRMTYLIWTKIETNGKQSCISKWFCKQSESSREVSALSSRSSSYLKTSSNTGGHNQIPTLWSVRIWIVRKENSRLNRFPKCFLNGRKRMARCYTNRLMSFEKLWKISMFFIY